MRRRTGFGNCNDVTATDGPRQRDGGCRATVRGTNTCKCGITQEVSAGAAERRIGHHRHGVLLAPWQQIMLNAAVADVVKDLIRRAAIAAWSAEEALHIADFKVGHAPSTNLARRPEFFNRRHDNRKVGESGRPVQQIEIEIISTETSKAPLARACDAVFRCMTGQYLGDQKYAIALTSDHAADEFLGAAVTVHFSRVD